MLISPPEIYENKPFHKIRVQLKSGEIVHHLDGEKLNNNYEISLKLEKVVS